MKKHTNPPSTKKKQSLPKEIRSTVMADDRLGPDEPLDQANALGGAAPGVGAEDEEAQKSSHRVKKIEPDDEHNNENLVEEGMQGFMHGSLTKPRKTK